MFFAPNNDNRIYIIITMGIAANCNIINNTTLSIRKIYLIALFLKLQFLNFKANNFILEFSR